MRSETRSDSRMFGEVLRTLLRQGWSGRFQSMGRSMHPAIKNGTEIQVEPALQVNRGDVVMVETSEGFRVHRVEADDEGIITRGDCCFDRDSVETVLGNVRVVSDGAAKLVDRQTLSSMIRRWIARWRGHF